MGEIVVLVANKSNASRPKSSFRLKTVKKITQLLLFKAFETFSHLSKHDFDVGLVTYRMKSAKRHRKEPTVHRSFSELPNSGRN